jgi:hypothetical protein
MVRVVGEMVSFHRTLSWRLESALYLRILVKSCQNAFWIGAFGGAGPTGDVNRWRYNKMVSAVISALFDLSKNLEPTNTNRRQIAVRYERSIVI